MKTDEQIIAEREEGLAQLDEEQRQEYLRKEYEEDVRICQALSRELQAAIEPIQGDLHHVKVNGEVLGYNGFAQYKKRRAQELLRQQEEKPQQLLRRGFFIN